MIADLATYERTYKAVLIGEYFMREESENRNKGTQKIAQKGDGVSPYRTMSDHMGTIIFYMKK